MWVEPGNVRLFCRGPESNLVFAASHGCNGILQNAVPNSFGFLKSFDFLARNAKTMQADSKKRKIEGKSSLSTPFAPSDYKDTAKTSRDNWKVPLVQNSSMSARIQPSKNSAVAQAQQEGCTGNYRIFDSPFGNFLVPVIPSRAELSQ